MGISKKTWLRIIRIIAPIIIARTVPGGKILAPIVAAGMEEAEGLGKPGAEKLKHVVGLVKVGATAANATGKVNLDVDKTAKAAEDAISVVVNLANAYESQAAALETLHKSVE